VVNGCLPNWHLWVADKEARGPADIWGNGPLAASSPDPLVAVTRMCGLLCMCSTTQARHSAAKHGGEPSSRQVDELLDERDKRTGSRLVGQRPRDRKRYKIADYPKVTNRTKGRVTLLVSIRPAGYRLRTRTRMLATTCTPKTPPQFRGAAPTAARTAAGVHQTERADA